MQQTKQLKKLTVGSIIQAKATVHTNVSGGDFYTDAHTISLVDKVEGDKLYCSLSVVSVNGDEYKPTKKVYKHYEGETLSTAQLIGGNEFDVAYEHFPRRAFKNL